MKRSYNFFEVWGGISGCQHLLPLLLNVIDDPASVLKRERLIQLTSEAVATRFRITEKGSIALGKDADLTLIQKGVKDPITRDSLRYRHKQSAFVQLGLQNRITRTILRGQTIWSDGKLAERPTGRLVRPAK